MDAHLVMRDGVAVTTTIDKFRKNRAERVKKRPKHCKGINEDVYHLLEKIMWKTGTQKSRGIAPCPNQKEQRGRRCFFHNSITGIFMVYQDRIKKIIPTLRTPRKFRMIFYNFCYYFWSQHCYRTATSMLATIFCCFFIIFNCPQLFHWYPCPNAAPASLVKEKNCYALC